ncbi:MAG TPA: phosphotransferase family protein [Candidatus Binatia bacterium]|nr:phosphotransferase family protein [Candidatus Binatia bacterium]
MTAPATGGRSTSTTQTERLATWLAARLGVEGVAVEGLRRLAGGASRELWAFDVVRPDGTRERLVLRRDPPGHHVQSSRRDEFALLRAAADAGLPVPRVRWCEDDATVLDAPFFVMDLVAGETLARRLLRDAEYAPARSALPAQLADALARIHRIDPALPGLEFLPRPAAGESPAAAELARYDQIYRAIAPDPHPALELAFRWLAPRLPPPRPPAVVHGDYRIGNVIFGPEGLRAVLDWELAHVGDPLEDLGWLCVRSWRFGGELPVGGLCERDELFAAYERSARAPVDRAAVRWWEVFGNLKWGIICIMQARTFLDRAVDSIELASLGRRVAEMELELLELTEG